MTVGTKSGGDPLRRELLVAHLAATGELHALGLTVTNRVFGTGDFDAIEPNTSHRCVFVAELHRHAATVVDSGGRDRRRRFTVQTLPDWVGGWYNAF